MELYNSHFGPTFGFKNFNAGLNTSRAEVTRTRQPGAKRGYCIYGTIVHMGGGETL